MPHTQRYVVHLLGILHKVLEEQGRGSESAMIALVRDKIGQSPELQPALEELYTVAGFDQIALRLMWYAERAKAQGETLPPDRVVEYQVRQLASDVPLLGNTPPAEASAGAESKPAGIPRDWEAAVRHFGDRLDELRKLAFDGDRYIGLPKARLEPLVKDASANREASADAR